MAHVAATAASEEPGVDVRLLNAVDAGVEDVLAADRYVFATPENLAAISGMMKDFFDRIDYAALDRVAGPPYAAMICAGSEGENAARQIARIATGWRLRAIVDPMIVFTRAQTPQAIAAPKIIAERDLERCRVVAATLAAGLVLGIFYSDIMRATGASDRFARYCAVPALVAGCESRRDRAS